MFLFLFGDFLLKPKQILGFMKVKLDCGGPLSEKSYAHLFSLALEDARLNVVIWGWILWEKSA